MIALITLIGQALSIGGIPEFVVVFPAFLTAFFMTASSFTINDYIDHEIDAINTPWRPIPSGLMTRSEALRFGLILGFIGVALSLLTSTPASILAVGSLLISFFYSLKGKYMRFLGNIMVALSISSSFIFGVLTTMEYVTPKVIGIFLTSFLYILGGEITQSISDVEGDRIKGVRSITIVNGPKVAATVATIFYVLTAIVGALISFLYGTGLGPYTVIIVFSTIGMVMWITYPLLKNPDKETAIKIRKRINYLAYIIISALLAISIIT